MAWYLTDDVVQGWFPDEMAIFRPPDLPIYFRERHLREDGKDVRCDVVKTPIEFSSPDGTYLIRFYDQDRSPMIVPQEKIDWEKIVRYE